MDVLVWSSAHVLAEPLNDTAIAIDGIAADGVIVVRMMTWAPRRLQLLREGERLGRRRAPVAAAVKDQDGRGLRRAGAPGPAGPRR